MNAAPTFDESPSMLFAGEGGNRVCGKDRPTSRVSSIRERRSSGGAKAVPLVRAYASAYCSSSLKLSSNAYCTTMAVDHMQLIPKHVPAPLPHVHTAPLTPTPNARPMPFHPHTNVATAGHNPRAGLTLLLHALNAIRATGGSGTHAVTLNRYVEGMSVREEHNVVTLTVDIGQLFAAHVIGVHHNTSSGCMTGHVPDDLQRAVALLMRNHGPTVEIDLYPVMSAQRTQAAFLDHIVTGDAAPRHSEEAGKNCLHYFGPVFRGPTAANRGCGPADIVCGFVVPDLVDVAHLLPDRDALPSEPLFFEKSQCMVQFFNGDATFRHVRAEHGATPNHAMHRHQPAAMTESDVVSAFAIATFQRPNLGPRALLPHPQWYQPFSVRIPHFARTIEDRSTTPVGVGSTVNTLEHGLRPASLTLMSDALDRAIVLAVLRLAIQP